MLNKLDRQITLENNILMCTSDTHLQGFQVVVNLLYPLIGILLIIFVPCELLFWFLSQAWCRNVLTAYLTF